MPNTDPEKRREYNRTYREKNRARLNEYRRQYWRENRDELLARRKAYENSELFQARRKAYQEANRGKAAARKRAERAANPELALSRDLRRRHGRWIMEDRAAMWTRQEGRCYLCGCDLTEVPYVIDHDHGCCPPKRSCRNCRRGLACNDCNVAIGLVRDSPERLRLMANNLEAVLRASEKRRADLPQQLELLNSGSGA